MRGTRCWHEQSECPQCIDIEMRRAASIPHGGTQGRRQSARKSARQHCRQIMKASRSRRGQRKARIARKRERLAETGTPGHRKSYDAPMHVNRTANGMAVFAALSPRWQYVADVAAGAGIPVAQAADVLCRFETAGWAVSLSGRRRCWRITRAGAVQARRWRYRAPAVSSVDD